MMFGLGPIELVFSVIGIMLTILPIWRILSRTGHSGAWALLAFVPVVNWVALYVFAFSRWPAVDDRRS